MAQFLHVGARAFAGNPAGIIFGRRDLAIKRHGAFHCHQRSAGSHEMKKRFVELVGFLLLLFELLGQHGFLLLRRQVLTADAIGQLLELELNLRVDFFQLIVQLGDFRIRRTKLRAEFGDLNFQVSFF